MRYTVEKGTQLVADAIIELSINPAKAKNVLYYLYI
jgi:hypothetical protein